MVPNGQMTVADIKRVLRRYWWVLPLSTVVCGALGFLATFVLPKKYTSSTRVLVEQPVVSTEYVRPVVTDDLNQRLASMKAEILSSSRLQAIIEKLNLFAEDRGKVPMDDMVEGLQKAINVELLQPMAGSSSRQSPGFFVSVSFKDPGTAQKICTEISSMFIGQDVLRNEEKGTKTTAFLTDELQTAKAKLDEQDAALAQFKRQYLGSLPDEESANLSLLTGYNTQLEAATQALNRAQQDKSFNETMLAQQEAAWQTALKSGTQNPDTLADQLAALQEQLRQMLYRYKPDHPDVVKLNAQIQDIKRRMTADASSPAPASETPAANQAKMREPAQITSLRARIKQDEFSIADLTKRQGQIQEQIRILQGRVQASPMVEERYKELTRNYTMAQQIYNELMKKQSDSTISKDLLRNQESERFSILDPPSYPLTPSSPKVLQLVLGGLGGGFALALAFMYLMMVMDTAMYTERDVETTLQLPVLTMVPSFDAMMGAKTNGSKGAKGKDKKSSERFEPAVALKA